MIDPEYVAEPLRRRIRELEAENKRLREALQAASDRIKQLAFAMPPPNEWTPQFIMVAQGMEYIARAALSQEEKT